MPLLLLLNKIGILINGVKEAYPVRTSLPTSGQIWTPPIGIHGSNVYNGQPAPPPMGALAPMPAQIPVQPHAPARLAGVDMMAPFTRTEALFGSTASTHATATSFSTVAMEPGQWWLSTSPGRVQRLHRLTYERWRNAPGSAPDGTGSRPRGSDPTTLSKRRRV